MIRNVAAVMVCVLMLASGVGIGAGSPCEQSAGSTERMTYPSIILGQEMYYTIYLPACYDASGQEYPVLYLMHGSNEDDGHWQRLGLLTLLDEWIASGQIAPVIVVMPFGNVIANRNRFDRLSWGEIFRQELLPAVESRYRISTERSLRAIGGISRGGFWAYQIALSHPALFSIVGGHSAFFDPYHAEAVYNPLDLIGTLTDAGMMRFWLDRGADDFAAAGLDLMHERMQASTIAHTYQIYPQGEHNNAYWSAHIQDYLQFYTQSWQQVEEIPAQSGSLFVTNTPVAGIPQATPAATEQPMQQTLFPIVAFASLRTSIDGSVLERLRGGEAIEGLVLADSVAQQLERLGYRLHATIERLPLDQVLLALRQNRERFTLLPLDAITLEYRVLLVDDLPATMAAAWVPLLGNDLDRLARLTFSGVTALARNTRLTIEQYGVEWAASGISDMMRHSDLFHISSEVSAVEGCPQSPTGEFLGGANSMCAQPEHLALFDLLGVDLVELTGNHNADYGYAAYLHTLERLHERGYRTVGGGATLAEARQAVEVEIAGNRIAIVACNAAGPYYALVNEDPMALGGVRPGAADCDQAWLAETLPRLAAQSDVLIVSVQYIEVEDYLPLPDQRVFFRQLAEWGADVVLGSAAHKPQTFEWVQRGQDQPAWIHYGLGNLFFDQPFWGNMRFFLDTLLVYDGQLRAIELIPGIIEDQARPRLMTEEERFNFLYFMFVEQNGF